MFMTEIDTNRWKFSCTFLRFSTKSDAISNPVPASTMWAFHRPRDSYTCCIPPSHSVLSGTAVLPHSVNVSFIVVHLLRVVLSPYSRISSLFMQTIFRIICKTKSIYIKSSFATSRSKLPLM